MGRGIDYNNVYISQKICKQVSNSSCLYSNVADFTATPVNDTKKIAIAGLPAAVTLSVLAVLAGGCIYKINDNGDVYNVPLTNIQISGSEIILNDFEHKFYTTDSVYVVLYGESR